jgi:hypothetical protein
MIGAAMKRSLGLMAVGSLVVFADGVIQAKPSQSVVLPSVRVRLSAPAGWHEVGSSEVIANRKRIVLKDAELQKAVASQARLPQFAFTKHPADYGSLNPSVQFVSRPAEGFDAVGAIQQAIGMMRSAVAELRVLEPPAPRQIAGRTAAVARFKYKVGAPTGDNYEVESRLIVIVDGSELAIIGFTGTTTGTDRCEIEFQALLKSIQSI